MATCTLSTYMLTCDTATLSLAFVEICTWPETRELATGEVITTVGGVESTTTVLLTEIWTLDCPTFDAASLQATARVWLPFATLRESHEKLNG
jgi:hypothetical protein